MPVRKCLVKSCNPKDYCSIFSYSIWHFWSIYSCTTIQLADRTESDESVDSFWDSLPIYKFCSHKKYLLPWWTLAVLVISLKWIRNVAPMLKTCVFTIWTCEKKDGCNRRLMSRAMSKNVFNHICSAISRWAGNSKQILALFTKQCGDSISRLIFWKIYLCKQR